MHERIVSLTPEVYSHQLITDFARPMIWPETVWLEICLVVQVFCISLLILQNHSTADDPIAFHSVLVMKVLTPHFYSFHCSSLTLHQSLHFPEELILLFLGHFTLSFSKIRSQYKAYTVHSWPTPCLLWSNIAHIDSNENKAASNLLWVRFIDAFVRFLSRTFLGNRVARFLCIFGDFSQSSSNGFASYLKFPRPSLIFYRLPIHAI
jgi:hypothetical protein